MSLSAFKEFANDRKMPVYPTFNGSGELEPVKGGDAVYFPQANCGAIIPRTGDPIYFGEVAQAAPLLKQAIDKTNEAANDPHVEHTKAPLELPSTQAIQRKPIMFKRFKKADIKPTDWLIKDYLETDSLSVIYGPPANGKSFVALDWAACIATGKEWHGQRVQQGAVFYLVGEGFNGIARRLAAWEQLNKRDLENAPLYVSDRAAILTDQLAVQETMSAIQMMVDESGETPILFLIDTLARNFQGNENSQEDMGRFITHVDAIKAHFNCSVMIVHHSGKDGDKGARGSSALKGAVDTEYQCSIAESESGKVTTVKNTKMKDSDTPPPRSFILEPQKLNVLDEDRQPTWSAALVETDYQEPQAPQTKRLGVNQAKAMEILRGMIVDARVKQESEGLTEQLNEVRRDDFRQKLIFEKLTTSNNYSTFENKLENRGLIKRQGGYIRLNEAP
ncbi:AAA family ATPase [Marinomonas fungiae]|uniref:AAA family ATPase n=1 Tax=Marinomonas fungiae TaxID=1137284 RepID=UPI003A8EB24E